MNAIKDPYVYAIIRVDIKTFQSLNDELVRAGYYDVKAVIPTVSLLRKTVKGENVYTVMPMLFNYGFFRIRRSKLFNRDYVNNMRKEVSGLYSWVRSLETIHPKKVKRRVDNAEDFDDYTKVATISRAEIRRLLRISKKNSIFNSEDITGLEVGSFITLRGYPYDSLPATVLDISLKEKMVKVQICHSVVTIIVDISFDHVFYTPYLDHDPDYLLANTHQEFIENTCADEDEDYSIEDYQEND